MDYNKVESKSVAPVKEAEVAVEKVAKVQQVVSKGVRKQKKGLLERLVVGMIGPDGLPAIGRYLGKEVILPAVKNIIVDSLTSGINMAVYGDSNKGKSSYTNRTPVTPTHTNYQSRYTSTQAPVAYQPVPVKPQVTDYIISTRDEAITVLDTLRGAAESYGSVAVADYYEAIGVPSEYTDNSFGWSAGDLVTNSTIIPTRGGFIIKFPPTSVL